MCIENFKNIPPFESSKSTSKKVSAKVFIWEHFKQKEQRGKDGILKTVILSNGIHCVVEAIAENIIHESQLKHKRLHLQGF